MVGNSTNLARMRKPYGIGKIETEFVQGVLRLIILA
jgi:hypothetical protein